MKFKDSELAHKYLDNLEGIEIGAGAHNPFNLPKCKNVDYTDDMFTSFKLAEERNCGEKAKVDIVAYGDDLPLKDESIDYVISSHVIEHFLSPIKAINEWLRVIRPGGYIFIICPHALRVSDERRPVTKLQELIDRHTGALKEEDINYENGHADHRSVWDLEGFLKMCNYLKLNIVESQEIDDKVGNGFTVVIQK
jgi:ubiquinone/menaquinone biosynthesis C-methylase UbiE